MKKQILLPFVLLGAAGLITSLGACQPRSQEEKPEEGYGVAITNKDALNETWYAGTSRALDIELTPAANVMQEYTTGALKIESSNPEVVSITGANANALAEGQATVTVKYHGWKDTVDLTISRKQTIQEKYGVTHAGTSADPLTNEEALVVAKHEAYEQGQEDLYVGGTIASFYHAPGSRTDGAVSWFLTPAEGQTEKFEVYKCYKEGTGSASYLTDDDVWVGGYAVAHGRFTSYNGQYETSAAIFDRCEGDKPAPRTTINATFAEALAAGKALEDGADSYDYYQFDAYVTKKSGTNYFLTATSGEAITDEKANTIEIYNAAAALDAKLTKNAKITIKMILKNYHGQVENLLALTADDITVVTEGSPWVIPEHNVTVAQGLEVVNGLADGATTADLYNFTEVYVKEVTGAYSAEFGNMSFTIADTADGTNTITVFRAKTDATTAAKVVAGAQVTVKGNLQKYVKNETMTPELLNVASITVKDSGGTTMVPGIVDTPVAGVKYKFGMKVSAAADKTADVFSTGVKSGNYGATTETFADAADFELVAVTGGYNVKVTLSDNSIKYLNGVVSGDYTNISFDDAASTVFTYDTAAKTLFFTANGHTTATKDGVYYFGTYTSKGSTYTTISCSMASYIQGDNASKIDASQFPAHFWELVEDTSGGEGGGEGGGGEEQTAITTMQAIYESGKAGDAIDVKGVYVGNYGNKTNEWYVANGDYAIYMYKVDIPSGVSVGDSVRIQGNLGVYKGLIQVVASGATITKIDETISYNSLTFTGGSFSKALLSRPVQITGTVKAAVAIDGTADKSVTVTVGTTDVTVYVKKSYGLDYTALNTAFGTAGATVTIKGYVGIYDGASTVDYATSTGYQIVNPSVVA